MATEQQHAKNHLAVVNVGRNTPQMSAKMNGNVSAHIAKVNMKPGTQTAPDANAKRHKRKQEEMRPLDSIPNHASKQSTQNPIE